tara:strand:+ start:111 stop:1013 length:903 start_codon:yes stop_codon:yes gene_type:complete
MDKCPIKEQEILFECVKDTENSLFEPIPAKKVRPEWFKKLPMYLDNVTSNGIEKTETIKRCPAMQDWMNMGYLIRNRHTVLVVLSKNPEQEPISLALALKDDIDKDKFTILKKMIKSYNENGSFDLLDKIHKYVKNHRLLVEELDNVYVVGGHPAVQTQGSGFDDKMAFKFSIDFLITTPKGTSTYWLDPFLFNNPYFHAWQGIIDTDSFNQLTTNNMCIFYPKADSSFIIPKGTPLVQVVPFVRTPWKHTVKYLTREEILDRMQHPVIEELEKRGDGKNKIKEHHHFYRKNLASKKEFK